MKKKHYLALGSLATLMLFSGCQDEEFGYTKEEINTQASFERHFGKIAPDQIWDFSSYNLNRLGLESNFSHLATTAATRAAYGGIEDTPDITEDYAKIHTQKWYEVPTELTDWLDLNLREEVFNRKRGATNFTLEMPTDRDIVIIPIYQGQAGLVSNLCIKSEETENGEPLFPAGAIWHKSQGIQIVDNSTGAWKNIEGDGFYASTVGSKARANAVQIKHYDPVTRTGVRGKFSLYLDVKNLTSPWDGQNGSPAFSETFMNKKQASSTEGQMVAVSLANDPIAFNAVSEALKTAFAQPTEGNYGYTYQNFMLIGCEDSNIKRNITTNNEGLALIGTDWDMNDMVFLVAGLTLDNIVTNQTIKKRYMVEDLGTGFGGYYDYDFNDIVIDVTQEKKIESNGTITTRQTLSLKHLCGTIPWQVKVGDYTSPIFPGCNNNTAADGYDPEVGSKYMDKDIYHTWKGTNNGQEVEGIINIEITGWDPDANNIVMTAWPDAAGLKPESFNTLGVSEWSDDQMKNFLKEVDGTSYVFPRPGQYPFIIACDQTQNWNPEHETIPESAIVTWKKPGYETETYPGTTPGQGGGTSGGSDDRTDDINSVAVPIVPGDGPVDVNVKLDSWADDILILPEFLQGIQAGYTIKAYIEPTDGAKMMYLSMKAPWKSIGDNMEMGTEATTFEVVVTPNNLADLKQYGIALKGVNVTVKSVEIIPGEWVDPERPVLHWDIDYNINIGDYKPSGWIVATDCQDLAVGDVITVYATANPSGNWGDYVRLQITDSNWNNFANAQDYLVWPNTPITYQLTITEDILASIKANGFNVQGHSVILNKITNSHPTLYNFTAKPTSGCIDMGKVTVSPDQRKFQAGSTVRIKAEAYNNYRFVSWSDNNTNAERDVVVSEDNMELLATFEAIPTHTVTIKAGANGTIKVNGVVADLGTFTTTAPEGKTFEIEAVGNVVDNGDGTTTSYKFSSWSDGGAKKHTITVGTEDLTITATFVEGEEPVGPIVLFEGEITTGKSGTLTKLAFSNWPTDSADAVGKTVKVYYEGGWLNVLSGDWGSNIQAGEKNPREFTVTNDLYQKISSFGGVNLQGEYTKVTKVTLGEE